jgi:hypothetical protein
MDSVELSIIVRDAICVIYPEMQFVYTKGNTIVYVNILCNCNTFMKNNEELLGHISLRKVLHIVIGIDSA